MRAVFIILFMCKLCNFSASLLLDFRNKYFIIICNDHTPILSVKYLSRALWQIFLSIPRFFFAQDIRRYRPPAHTSHPLPWRLFNRLQSSLIIIIHVSTILLSFRSSRSLSFSLFFFSLVRSHSHKPSLAKHRPRNMQIWFLEVAAAISLRLTSPFDNICLLYYKCVYV